MALKLTRSTLYICQRNEPLKQILRGYTKWQVTASIKGLYTETKRIFSHESHFFQFNDVPK